MSTSETTEPQTFSEPGQWNNAAAQYNDAVGRSTRLAAARLIALTETLDPPLSAPDARAIDLGAGTGSLTHELAAHYPELPILATDISSGMLDQLSLSTRTTDKITTQIADMAAPVGGAAKEGGFSHVFSTMAIQVLPDPAGEGNLAQWERLLVPGGIIAIGIWDFDENCGPLSLWAEAATAVDPAYVDSPLLPPRHWTGCAQLEQGLKAAGFQDVRAEVAHVGFNVGKEGFMRFIWESGNPMAVDRQATFKGDLMRVKIEMERLLDEKYDGGARIPLSTALAVGHKARDLSL
jgi:SAM-dependent methyltransferase